MYDRLPDLKAAEQELARAGEIQQEIWSRVVSASRNDPGTARLLLSALNEMIDITTTRSIAMTAGTRCQTTTQNVRAQRVSRWHLTKDEVGIAAFAAY